MCFESIRCILRACECIMRVYWFISNVCKCFLEICNCVLKAYEFILKAWKCILKAYEFDFKTYEYILRPKECIWYYCVKSVRTRSYSDPHFSRIFPHLDWIRRDTISPYSVQMRENADQNNPEYGLFFTQFIYEYRLYIIVWCDNLTSGSYGVP